MYPRQLLSQIHLRVLFVTSILLVILGKSHSQAVPALFVFGDSLVDAGNNNYIATIGKANLPPNGIDFGRPTGRFTNGKSIIDIIGKELGFQNYIPPFLDPTAKGPVVLKGVNYASGGSGILNLTGIVLGGHICMDEQVDNFAKTRQGIISNIGPPAASALLGKSLFWVTIGSNDFIVNFLKLVPEQNMIAANLFIKHMIQRFRTQLMRLYSLGARKFVVSNVGALGCMPYMRDHYGAIADQCVQYPNQVADLYNGHLKSLVDKLRSTLAGSEFVYTDVNHIFHGILQNYTSYGFSNDNSACCHSAGRYGGLFPCIPGSKVCEDRSKYVFWDAYHPTEATLLIVATHYLHGGPPDVSPMNVWQLVKS